jgi:aspartate aminotransferase
MISQKYKDMLQAKSVIREMSAWANQRGAEISYENVFDYSLGNPSVPVPQAFTDKMIELLQTRDVMELHGYSQSQGIPSVRAKFAAYLNKTFGMNYTAEHIFMTTGAAGAVAHAVRAVTQPGDEVITFAPYFPEYHHYVNQTGAVLKVVPADTEQFQIHFGELEKAINSKTMAVLINTPNNPSGTVYSTATLQKLAALLEKKQKEYGHDIFIISDEPYREIVFDGVDAPYVSTFYQNTLSCYLPNHFPFRVSVLGM